jgi:hypothetical protein
VVERVPDVRGRFLLVDRAAIRSSARGRPTSRARSTAARPFEQPLRADEAAL